MNFKERFVTELKNKNNLKMAIKVTLTLFVIKEIIGIILYVV